MEIIWHNGLELAGQFFKVGTFFIALVLPATWVAVRRVSGLSLAPRLGLGAAAGFALFVVGAAYLGRWSFDFLFPFWVVQFPIAAAMGWRRQVVAGADASNRGHAVSASRNTALPSWLIVGSLMAAVGLQLYSLQFSILPHGADASFHCVVARRQLDAWSATTNLWPLEALELNYPIGSHIWVAVVARWTGLAVHEVFRHSFTIAICGTCMVLAGWSERIFGEPLAGAATAFAFIFCTFQASLFPVTWGGLPSLMAMWIAMAGLYCVSQTVGHGGLAVSALLFGATALVHHHTLVALFGGSAALAGIGWFATPALRLQWRRVLLAVAGGFMVAGPYTIPLLGHMTQLHQTGVLKFTENFGWPWEQFWNWEGDWARRTLTFVMAVSSVVIVFLGIRAGLASGRSNWLILGLAGIWLLVFCLLDYGGRVLAALQRRESIQPFTPSRFLFDAQFVFAVYAGGGLVTLGRRLGRPAFQFALLGILVCGAVWQTEPRWRPKPDDALLQIGAWADRNLPPDALMSGSPSDWITYVFHRESTSLFIPISEPAEPNRHHLKRSLLADPMALSWSEWRNLLGKPLFMIGYAHDPNAMSPPVVVSDPFAIYDVNGEMSQ